MNYLDFYRDLFQHYKHTNSLHRTGFWGEQGAGCIFLAKDTKRIGLSLRSKNVQEANTWGGWGGAIDSNETPEKAVRREVWEESGYTGHLDLMPLATFSRGKFKYYNFLAIVDREFKPRLDPFETQDYKWVEFGQWPRPLHFGLRYLIEQSGEEIQQVLEKL